jgi:hypothetical protein
MFTNAFERMSKYRQDNSVGITVMVRFKKPPFHDAFFFE